MIGHNSLLEVMCYRRFNVLSFFTVRSTLPCTCWSLSLTIDITLHMSIKSVELSTVTAQSTNTSRRILTRALYDGRNTRLFSVLLDVHAYHLDSWTIRIASRADYAIRRRGAFSHKSAWSRIMQWHSPIATRSRYRRSSTVTKVDDRNRDPGVA